ncbi:MAG: universal stress protein [Actinobacteria bacterium]|nr:universal stress protein [Actinomycetota bacterium]
MTNSGDRPRTVLAGIDGGPSSRDVLRSAATLADREDATVIVAHVVRPFVPILPEAAFVHDASVPDEVTATLFPCVVESLYDTSVAFRMITLVGDVPLKLAEVSRRLAPRAVVVGRGSNTTPARLRRWLSGTMSERLARLQPAPVMVVDVARPIASLLP